jgi:hypothetical protein
MKTTLSGTPSGLTITVLGKTRDKIYVWSNVKTRIGPNLTILLTKTLSESNL